jgi:hypothetical protein
MPTNFPGSCASSDSVTFLLLLLSDLSRLGVGFSCGVKHAASWVDLVTSAVRKSIARESELSVLSAK